MSYDYAGDLSPLEAWQRLEDDPTAQLIDVRTDAEWVFVGRPDLRGLGKEVLFLPWQRFPDGQRNPDFVARLKDEGFLEDQTLLFICRSGQRSLYAAKALAAEGFRKCYNVAQGFEGDKDTDGHRGKAGGWKVANLPWVQD